MGDGEKEVDLFVMGSRGYERFCGIAEAVKEVGEASVRAAKAFEKASITIRLSGFPLCLYPNKRVVRLALHGKKRLVQKRNMKRIQKWLAKNKPFDIW